MIPLIQPTNNQHPTEQVINQHPAEQVINTWAYRNRATEKIKEIVENILKFVESKDRKTFVLTGTQITSLPEIFRHLPEIEEIDLSNNQLTELPDSFKHLKKLQEINLSNNQLTSLPECFERLTSINNIYLAHNPIEEKEEEEEYDYMTSSLESLVDNIPFTQYGLVYV